MLKKYKITRKETSGMTSDFTGKPKNLIAFLKNAGCEDVEDIYPELY